MLIQIINHLLIFSLSLLLLLSYSTCISAEALSSSSSATTTTTLVTTITPVKLIHSKIFYPIDFNPIGICQPPCLNHGICRRLHGNKNDSFNENDSKCICTPDFKGIDCSEETETDLTNCQESTCKYGGTCVGTSKSPKCLCKDHTRGKRCERHDLIFVVELKLYDNGKEAIWQKDYEDKSSYLSNTKALDVCKLLKLSITYGSNLQLSNSLIDCYLINYYNNNNSVMIQLKSIFDIDLSLIPLISPILIKNQLMTGFQLINKTVNEFNMISFNDIMMENSSNFKVYVHDPCKNGNHDCSINAKCIVQSQGTYICECNAFTIDASFDANYPGRRCMYDGLIILAFAIIGGLICTLTVLICGCRRTIWRRYRRGPESIDLINMPRNYDI
ncbi:hypothetical protein Smp_127710 [Schistosoma mansoni]|uniref:EGF-like domain-containing protein n=1 Tax=Schistosoma mansoni TaxID=6183 RepID=G4VMM4_SCHMA|nr:hypothetical protein Smp_127710 [Schistosoma mansoni]|eukprot:XP_018653510.1 hypothetical protein Smp_127710 [Schistosoma mansoni]